MSPKSQDLIKEIDRLAQVDQEEVLRHLETRIFKKEESGYRDVMERLYQEGEEIAKKRGWTPGDVLKILAKIRAKPRS